MAGKIISVLILFLLTLSNAAAQERPIALLERGPYLKDRLPIPMVNYIKNWSGQYSYQGNTIYVYYLLTPLPVPEYWEKAQCGGFEHYMIPGMDLPIYYTIVDEKTGFVFIFKDAEDFWCTFILTFIERFNYFQGVITHEKEVPLPAILNLFQ